MDSIFAAKIRKESMKRYVFIAGLALILGACSNGADNQMVDSSDVKNPNTASADGADEGLAGMEFENNVYDFGTITQGEKVTHNFKFKNNGEAELVIVSAKGSCGCTVPEWPKEPIAVGAEGEINVVFNSDGKKGVQKKNVTIVANTTPATTTLTLKGEIIAPEEGEG